MLYSNRRDGTRAQHNAMFEGNTLELQHIRMLCERVKCTQEPLPRYIVAFAARIPGSILTSGESLFTVAVPRGIFTRFPLAGASSSVVCNYATIQAFGADYWGKKNPPERARLGKEKPACTNKIRVRKTRLHEQVYTKATFAQRRVVSAFGAALGHWCCARRITSGPHRRAR